jgi:Tfp pilus assembly protein PilO
MRANGRFHWDSRCLAWAAGVLGASAAFWLLVAWPQMARARDLAETVSSERAELAARYQSLEVLGRAEKEADELAARAADFHRRIPSEPMLGSFLEDLARMAQKHGLQSGAVQPGEPAPSAEVVTLPIAIQVRGSFAGIHGLLQDIERRPRLTRIDQFKATTSEEYPGQVTAELKLRIYYLATQNGAQTG